MNFNVKQYPFTFVKTIEFFFSGFFYIQNFCKVGSKECGSTTINVQYFRMLIVGVFFLNLVL